MERAMSEFEFDRVMEAVRAAIGGSIEDSLAALLAPGETPKFTNDNVSPAWQMATLSEGGHVA
jgi:hypothetical protein